MIIILSILIAMVLLTIGLNVGIKDFKKLRGIVEDEKLTETIKNFPSNTEICRQTLKKLNNLIFYLIFEKPITKFQVYMD